MRQRAVGPETLLRIATDYTGVVPDIVRSWDWEPDGKTVVMHFVRDASRISSRRKGRWSVRQQVRTTGSAAVN